MVELVRARSDALAKPASTERRGRAGRRLAALLATVGASLLASAAHAEQLRDLVNVSGARDNELLGYGIVTGLDGTGDDLSAPMATQSMLAMLRRLGIQIEPKQLRLRNIAAVVVTATVPAFSRPGNRLDVTVSSVGNARALSGGVLVQTVLKGADRKSYAVAQGNLLVGGVGAQGRSGSSVSSGSRTTGRVPAGAIVERDIATQFVQGGKLELTLRNPSFSVAARVAEVVSKDLGQGKARAVDGGTVVVDVPADYKARPVALLARLEVLEIKPDRRARVVVSERTQTIVAGGDVRLAPVVVVHGDLTIVIKEKPAVSQPTAPLTRGKTTVVPRSEVKVEEPTSTAKYLSGAASLADLASALGSLGLPARELVGVLEALRTAGALEAEVVVQ